MKSLWLIPVVCLVCVACEQGSSHARTDNKKSQEESSDWAITTKVKSAILADSTLSASSRFVSVETNNGVVTLSGNVASKEDRDRIVKIAKDINGVKSVDNQMTMPNE